MSQNVSCCIFRRTISRGRLPLPSRFVKISYHICFSSPVAVTSTVCTIICSASVVLVCSTLAVLYVCILRLYNICLLFVFHADSVLPLANTAFGTFCFRRRRARLVCIPDRRCGALYSLARIDLRAPAHMRQCACMQCTCASARTGASALVRVFTMHLCESAHWRICACARVYNAPMRLRALAHVRWCAK